MIDRRLKLKWRRRVRNSKRQVEDFGTQTDNQLEQYFFRRLPRLYKVKRFAASWLGLIAILIFGSLLQISALQKYYLEPVAVPGGTFTEGILGVYTDSNPIYASGPVDGSVARLVYSGLLRYDNRGILSNDLAENWTSDENGAVFTINLRPNVRWHDGAEFTSEDVVFTYNTIKNADAKSPLQLSWQGIIVEAPEKYKVVFRLPNALASFPHNLTNGIIPKHILGKIEPAQLRSQRFNTSGAVGTGPFKMTKVQVNGLNPQNREEQIGLSAYDGYHLGRPALDQFIIRAIHNEERLLDSLINRELNAVAGLNALPENLKDNNIKPLHITENAQTALFLNTSSPLLADAQVRRGIVQSVNTAAIISKLNRAVIKSDSPFLRSHIGYDGNLVQLKFDPVAAAQTFDRAGWLIGEDGIRRKNGAVLQFRIDSINSSEFTDVAAELKRQLRTAGIAVEVNLIQDSDIQAAIAGHSYDALLYTIALGPDPDVFPFWHSSQADPRSANRFNLSEYKSSQADAALEAGRTRLSGDLRAVKYKPFLEAWRSDAPAAVLYQPSYLYVLYGPLDGFDLTILNSSFDRYANVRNWQINYQNSIKQ